MKNLSFIKTLLLSSAMVAAAPLWASEVIEPSEKPLAVSAPASIIDEPTANSSPVNASSEQTKELEKSYYLFGLIKLGTTKVKVETPVTSASSTPSIEEQKIEDKATSSPVTTESASELKTGSSTLTNMEASDAVEKSKTEVPAVTTSATPPSSGGLLSIFTKFWSKPSATPAQTPLEEATSENSTASSLPATPNNTPVSESESDLQSVAAIEETPAQPSSEELEVTVEAASDIPAISTTTSVSQSESDLQSVVEGNKALAQISSEEAEVKNPKKLPRISLAQLKGGIARYEQLAKATGKSPEEVTVGESLFFDPVLLQAAEASSPAKDDENTDWPCTFAGDTALSKSDASTGTILGAPKNNEATTKLNGQLGARQAIAAQPKKQGRTPVPPINTSEKKPVAQKAKKIEDNIEFKYLNDQPLEIFSRGYFIYS